MHILESLWDPQSHVVKLFLLGFCFVGSFTVVRIVKLARLLHKHSHETNFA
jgi:hypothetical protein